MLLTREHINMDIFLLILIILFLLTSIEMVYSVTKVKVEISLDSLSKRELKQFIELSDLSKAFDGFKIKVENCDGDNCLYIERPYKNNLCKLKLEFDYVYVYPKEKLIEASIDIEELSPYIAVVNGKKVQVDGGVCEELKEKYDWGGLQTEKFLLKEEK